MSKEERLTEAWKKIVKKAWTDPKFKEELIRHPDKILKDHGVNTDGKKIKIVQNSDHEVYLVIPSKPHIISQEDLRRTSAGDDDSGGEISWYPDMH